MPINLTSPETMPTPVPTGLYNHVAVAAGTRSVAIAGQVGWNADGELVSPDFREQFVQAFRNVSTALESVGGDLHDLVRLTIYAARWTPDKLEEFEAAIDDIRRDGLWVPVPISFIGVDILFVPEILVEIEATAVLN
jgi:enamine deaminase RidA (YjgF/YER057c/UK114 family)